MADSPRVPIHHDLIGFDFNADILDRDFIRRLHENGDTAQKIVLDGPDTGGAPDNSYIPKPWVQTTRS